METVVARSASGPTVTFWGAAQSVTGSMHLVEIGDHKVLLDCGSFRGSREEARRRNGQFPFRPRDIAAVVLSHAHLDHSGNLPHLVRQGFSGPIYCTAATRDLIAVMLGDAARLQEEDAYLQRILVPGAVPAPSEPVAGLPPDAELPHLYTRSHAQRTVQQCVTLPYEEAREILPGVELRLTDAGHILGSAMVHLRTAVGGRERSITFTGDIGRRGLPFMPEPTAMPAADLILSECTYGGRLHHSLEHMAQLMEDIVWRCSEEGGKVLIPAFSLGRTQLVVYYLRQWVRSGRLPDLPIFVDGPLAADIADVHRRHLAAFDPQVARCLEEDPSLLGGDDPVTGWSGDQASADPESSVTLSPCHLATVSSATGVRYIRSLEESKELSTRRGSCIIVAAGGMCEGGRILRHLKQNLDDPRCTIVLVSYQAPGTLGRKLLEPRPRVRFHGRDWNLWAQVAEVNGFSGHAGHDDLLSLLGGLANPGRRLRLVHGEPDQAATLAQDLRKLGFTDVAAPTRGETATVP